MPQTVLSLLEKLEKGTICKDWDAEKWAPTFKYYGTKERTSEEDSE